MRTLAIALASVPLLAIPAHSQTQPILTQFERQWPPVSRKDSTCKYFQHSATLSKLTVFDNHEVVYEPSEYIRCDDDTSPVPSWLFRFDIPPDNKRVYRHVLSDVAFAQIRDFLDRPDVMTIQSWPNANWGAGDFDIKIKRPTGVQDINVMNLVPYPNSPLVHLICRVKELGRAASKSAETAAWCKNLKPLDGDVSPKAAPKK